MMIAGLTFRDHADAGNWLANCVGVLTEFPECVVTAVTDPRTGLQNNNRRLPGNMDVRAACNARMDALRREYDAFMLPERLREKVQTEAQLTADKAANLSLAELKSKYGYNGSWLPPMQDPVREAARKRSEERNAAWNAEYIRREYAEHGLQPVIWKGVPITLHTARQFEALGKLRIEQA